MKKQNGIYPRGLEILKHPDCTVSHVVIDWDAAGSGVIPGGSPMSAAGRVANDSAAIGILRYNVYRGIHRTAPVVIGGYVDLEAAQANSGMDLSAEAKGAMPNLWFSDGGSRMGGGGLPTGGAAYQQLVTDGEGNAKWEDRLAYGGEETITWDGNTDGLACIELAPGYIFYKVSDLYFDRDLLVSFSYTTSNDLMSSGGEDKTNAIAESVWADNGAGIMVVTEPCTFDGVVFPESGLYLSCGGTSYVNKLTISFGKKIDKMFIPVMDSVILNSSTSGSTKKFKITVDDSGTISATEV